MNDKGIIRQLVEDIRGLGDKSKKILWRRMAVILPCSFVFGCILGLMVPVLASRGDLASAPVGVLFGVPLLLGVFTTFIWGYWGAFQLTLQLKDHERYLAEKAAYERGERKIPPVKLHWVNY